MAAGFRWNDLIEIAKRAGGSRATVQRHWPWFRISVVIPSGGLADVASAEITCSQDQATAEEVDLEVACAIPRPFPQES